MTLPNMIKILIIKFYYFIEWLEALFLLIGDISVSNNFISNMNEIMHH